jgi:hypothetical protein
MANFDIFYIFSEILLLQSRPLYQAHLHFPEKCTILLIYLDFISDYSSILGLIPSYPWSCMLVYQYNSASKDDSSAPS